MTEYATGEGSKGDGILKAWAAMEDGLMALKCARESCLRAALRVQESKSEASGEISKAWNYRANELARLIAGARGKSFI